MYRWRISIFGKTPARALGTILAPDQASAEAKAVEFYSIQIAQRFRVVALKLGPAKEARMTRKY